MADIGHGLGRLAGKVALITGASSGIGAGTAKMFSKLGAKLALSGRNEDNLKKTGDVCEKLGGNKVLCIQGDVTIEEDVKRIVEETVTHYGQLDILVNSAGILTLETIETTSLEQYDKLMNTNVRALYHITMLAVPHLINTKGNIVNVSSVNGIRSFPNMLTYCMSKSAVDQFTRCCALDLAPKQVRVNSVNPGAVVTEIHRRAGLDEETYQKYLEHTKITYPLGRPGQVEEVAAMIAFLASENASFITGAQIPIDGGRHVACPR
ncbi:3-oxoacyl-[acyl-carrier-protein] reductase FabG-like [Mercenaria mercenaria]|uniref:3-oxoacyl-[acyl-carrier-protein] reductase FabG-like n=1 Tax=Mercenaria mercenaria TaxID=6596 RepID=UPI00234F1C0D|nr:3-oxoacyl-[acyl-carrier-protein] reductase FabG-like [Mercenaria mercenaria]